MTVSSNEQVVFRDFPLALWLIGVIAIASGTIAVIQQQTDLPIVPLKTFCLQTGSG